MFYCNDCAKKEGWPYFEIFNKCRAKCEICGEEKGCVLIKDINIIDLLYLTKEEKTILNRKIGEALKEYF